MGTASNDKIDMDSDLIDPAMENWREMEDSEVYHAAKAGVPQAQKELERRETQVPK